MPHRHDEKCRRTSRQFSRYKVIPPVSWEDYAPRGLLERSERPPVPGTQSCLPMTSWKGTAGPMC
jgi:hypothetical protein